MPSAPIRTLAVLLPPLLFCAACAPRQVLRPKTAAPNAAASAPAQAVDLTLHHYVVRRGDSLWAIAAMPDVLGDPFLWPLLYRDNRDEISDPDLIYPRQDVVYHEAQARILAEIRKEAEETPAYVEHDKPRKELPMQY